MMKLLYNMLLDPSRFDQSLNYIHMVALVRNSMITYVLMCSEIVIRLVSILKRIALR